MRKTIMKYFTCIIAVLCITAELQATHVAGGSMTYRCLGNSRYEVTLEFRRDCLNGADNAQFDEFASISIFNSDNQLMLNLGGEDGGFDGQLLIPFMDDDTLNETLTSFCNVIGGDKCVQRTIYRDTLILPVRAGGYILAYQRCCRNTVLTNIQDPVLTGATYWVRIGEKALLECNSSPEFGQWPNAFICLNDTLRFDHSVIETDGDSLVYYLCAPSGGATADDPKPQPANPPPFEEVVYSPGFSINNMMGGSPISIDQNTGQIIAVPNQVGQFLIGVCVREYRNGELLSEIRRDFEYNVRICGRNPIASFEPDTTLRCDGLEISFENVTTSNFLPIDSLDFTWYFDWPRTDLVSFEQNPIYTFPEPGLYEVAMIVSDGMCIDTSYATIGVSTEDDPLANFNFDSFDCDGETVLQLYEDSETVQGGVVHQWIITHNGGVDTIFGESPQFILGEDQSITVDYMISTESGCTDALSQTIDVVTEPFRVEFEDKIICEGETAVIFSSNLTGITVTIDPPDNIINDGSGNYIYPGFSGSQSFNIFVTDGFCSADSTVVIQADVQPSFPLPDVVQCGDSVVELNPNGPDFYFYEWAGPGITDPNEVNPQVSVELNSIYTVTAYTSEGSLCFFSDELSVLVFDIPVVEILPAEQIIYCEGDSLLLSLASDFATVNWYNANGDLVQAQDSLLVTTLDSTSFYVAEAITAEGCSNTDSVFLTYIPEPVLNISPNTDTEVCGGTDAFLEVVSQDSITWLDPDGMILGTGNQLTLEELTEPIFVTIIATNEFGCELETGIFLDIFVDPEPDFTPLDDIVVCPNMIFPVTLNTTDSVNWFAPDGSLIETGPTFTIMNLVGNITYEVAVINEFGCEVRDTFDVIVDPSIVPDIDLSPLDSVQVCVDGDFVVELNTQDSVTWLDLDGNILQVGTEFIVEDLQDTLTFVVSVVDDFNCLLLDTFDINIYTGIDLMITNATQEIFYCEGEEVTINSMTDVNAEIQWFDNNVLIGEGNTLTYLPDGDVTIVGVAEDEFGCMSTDSIFLIESQTEGEIIGDDLICIGGISTLEYIPDVPENVFSINWSPQEGIVEDNGLTISVQPENTTVYTATYSNSDGCITEVSFEVEVTGFFEQIRAFADPNEILLSESSELSTDQDDDFDYSWEPTETLDDPNSPNPIATPNESTTYTVTVTDMDGCTGTANVTVVVIQPNCDETDIMVPNMFSPNGDDFNDVFKVESNFIEEIQMLVYNRLGQEIYRSEDLNAGWDGTFEGKELEPDVFGYHINIICINGLNYTKNGNITLIK